MKWRGLFIRTNLSRYLYSKKLSPIIIKNLTIIIFCVLFKNQTRTTISQNPKQAAILSRFLKLVQGIRCGRSVLGIMVSQTRAIIKNIRVLL